MEDEIPAFLTVAEAGRLLRISRTKAYDLTQKWRDTDGRTGLPVIDLDDVLRVPGPAIREMLRTGLSQVTTRTASGNGKRRNEPPTGSTARRAGSASSRADSPATNGAPTSAPPRARRTRRPDPEQRSQLPLFEPTPTQPPDSQNPSPS